jgi:hypothetical protein
MQDGTPFEVRFALHGSRRAGSALEMAMDSATLIDNRKQRCVSANAECERQYDHRGKAGLWQHSKGVAKDLIILVSLVFGLGPLVVVLVLCVSFVFDQRSEI